MHKLNRRPRRMCHELPVRARRICLWLVRHVLYRNSRQPDVAAMVLRLVYQRRTAASPGGAALSRRDGRLGGAVVQLVQRGGEVVGVHLLVGRVLKTDLPAMGWRRWRGDEEEFASIGESEAVVSRVHGGVLAEVDARAVAHDRLAVPGLADTDGRVLVGKGNDDTPEGLEGGPGVDGSGGVDERTDGLEVVRAEDVRILKICYKEGVGGRCRLRQRWERGEVESEGGGAGGGAAGEERWPRCCRRQRWRVLLLVLRRVHGVGFLKIVS